MQQGLEADSQPGGPAVPDTIDARAHIAETGDWVTTEKTPDIELAAAIGLIRRQIERAISDGSQSAVRFRSGPIELEMDVEFTKSVDLDGAIKAWVVSVGARGELNRATRTHIRITLHPVDQDGNDQLVQSLGRG